MKENRKKREPLHLNIGPMSPERRKEYQACCQRFRMLNGLDDVKELDEVDEMIGDER